MSTLARRALLMGATAVCLTFSAAAIGLSFTWGGGEQVRGDGKVARESRTVGSFEAISLAGHFELKVRQSDTPRVELEADGNLLPYVETKVVDGRNGKTLEIGVKRGYSLYSSKPLRIEVDAATLQALAIAGSGKAEIESMKADSLKFAVAGSGSVTALKLDTAKLTLSIAGSGDIVAGGRAAEMGVSIAGSGDVRARELASDEVKVSISGSGNADVQVAKKLKVSIAGSGDVRYLGEPQMETSVAGSGSVRKL